MNKKEILIICLIMCFILSLQAAAAVDVDVDNNDTGLKSQDVNSVSAYSLPDSQDTLQAGSGNAGTFADLQTDVGSGGSITLDKNYTWVSGDPTGGISITQSGTHIIGYGVTIDASKNTRVFSISNSAHVTLEGITFINGKVTSGNGGSILSDGELTIINCTFKDNTAEGNGGAIYTSGKATITKSIFKSNSVTGNKNSGGAINVGDNSVVSNSTFIANTAVGVTAGSADGNGGGAINALNHLTVKDNSYFINNTVSAGDGGAINADDYATISNSTFENNKATGARAGALWAKNYLKVSDCNFTGNTAKNYGGAIAVQTPTSLNSAPEFYNSRFVNNGIPLVTSDYGGGAINIRSEGNIKIIYNCTFINNYGKDGGAIKTLRLRQVVNCTFINNTATGGSGGAIKAIGANNNDDTNLVIINSTFSGNTATAAGGAIACGLISISNSNFTNNIAKGTSDASQGSGGGAVYVLANYGLTINNVNFTYNVAKRDGGAIYTSGTTIPDITYGNFIGNNATRYGGAVYSNSVTINNSNFTSNEASTSGGAVYATTVTVGNSNFTSNEASTSGGAVYATTMAVDNSNFTSNEASTSGGAVYATTVAVGNSNFTSNEASTSGGAVYATTVTISNSNFNGNKATGTTGDAGALYIVGNNANVSDSTFGDNNAARYGGAIYWYGANGVLKDSNFTGNNATDMGGAIYWYGWYGNISRSNFNKSKATDGGAVYFLAKSSYILYSNFTDNAATGNGGAVHSLGENNHMDYSIFKDNVASDRGGGIYARGLGTRITSNFTGNNATYGGGVYTGSDSGLDEYVAQNNPVYITHSNFTSNHATTDEGGALFAGFIFSQTLYCTFIDNSAPRGGAVSLVCERELLSGCMFINNTATDKGGSIYVQKLSSASTIQNSTFINSSALDGGAIYNKGGPGAGLLIDNDTFINNTATYNGGAIYYVVDAGGLERIYRDYNHFDGEERPSGNGRVSVDLKDSADDPKGERIRNSLFVNNNDYPINMTVDATGATAVVNLVNPKGIDKSSLVIIINITDKDDQLVDNFTIDSGNWDPDHWNRDKDIFYNSFLLSNEGNYTAIITFYDTNHIAKLANFTFHISNQTEGAFELLQKAINAATGSLSLNGPYVYDALDIAHKTGCINITKPITIYGNGWSVSAKGYCRIFNITSANVTLVGLSISDGNASGEHGNAVNEGGAIYWSGANGTLIKCTISDSYASAGGGLYLTQDATDYNINGSEFDRNYAIGNGGAIDCNAPEMVLENTIFENNHGEYGAALCREETATGGHGFNNTFISNHAEIGGAALGWIKAKSITITNYTFINNTAGVSGGAIFVGVGSESCLIINSTFEGNHITSDTAGHGGAIEWYAIKGTVINSTFTNNYAYDGGAIYANNQSNEIIINNSYFGYNYAYFSGGAISLEASNVNINYGTFRNNHAVSGGGAVYVNGTAASNDVSHSVFENNWVTNGNGGGIDWLASKGNIKYSNFTNNSAVYGGGIYLSGNSNNSVIEHVIFTGNNATKNGGAIDWNAQNGHLYYNQFISNYAGEYGAALCREAGATGGNGTTNVFISNHAGKSGAALAWMGSDNIKIVNYNFTNNTANDSGGAIYVSNTSNNCSVIDCNFIDNRIFSFNEESLGGAIYWKGSNGTVLNSNFTHNHGYNGGAIFAGAGEGITKITNSNFIENWAHEEGGAINMNASSVHLNYTVFKDNYALKGGAIFVGEKGADNYIYRSVFENNKAISEHDGELAYGGAIDWLSAAGKILYSNFTNNYADYGGAIYLNGKSNNTIMNHLIFTGNNATKNGGALDWNSQNGQLYNCLFLSNYAGEYGAALCREPEAIGGNGSNNTFKYNHAGKSGAALAWMDVDNININYYYFIENTANEGGAAIYISDGSDNCIINHSSFKGNYITNDTAGHGGAIYIVGDNATIVNSNFTENHAFNGGAIFAGHSSGNTNISNVTFDYNWANVDGGAILITGSGVDINNTRFYHNSASKSGGAVYVGGTGTSNVVWYTVFENNTAKDHGGAINWLAYEGEVFYSNFTNNSAVYGGGIYLNHISSSSKIVNVIFRENSATKNGGAIDCNASYMGLNNTQFISNYAGEYGAALCREAGAEHGYGGNNTFKQNYAGIAGAALAWLDVNGITINNYTFYNNTAKYYGGAIYVNKNSSNCTVLNSNFTLNYVEDVLSARGGVIDWLGANGTIYNSTFSLSYAIVAGSLYIASDNMNITKSNFTYSITLQRGGSILGENANNATIADCFFDNSAAIGYITPESKNFGQGGAIYWINSDNLTISNTQLYATESRGDGAIYLWNCNNSRLYNVVFNDSLSLNNGGSLSWINSANGTVDNCTFIQSEALSQGGAIYFDGVNNITVKNSKFNGTYATKDHGGSVYIDGNVTIDNNTFTDYDSYLDWGKSLYFHNGTSSVVNSTFNGIDAIWVYKYATVNLTENNITGKNPNKNMTYLEKDYDEKYNPVDYSVWNDGVIYLKVNNFDYVIFNNGTIMTQTYMDVLYNTTWNEEWNTTFTFRANITDDNNNTIISVASLSTYNNHPEYDSGIEYNMTYNRITLPLSIQDVFIINGKDLGLENCDYKPGTIYVRMPTKISVFNTTDMSSQEDISFTVKVSVPYQSNHTFSWDNLKIKINGVLIQDLFIDGTLRTINLVNYTVGDKWIDAYVNFTEHHLPVGSYTLTADYERDDFHEASHNETTFSLFAHEIWLEVHAADIYYGQPLVIYVNSSAKNTVNGRIRISINGKIMSEYIQLDKNGSCVYRLPNDDPKYSTYLEPGIDQVVSVSFENGTYYASQSNFSYFNVYKLDSPLNVTPINITYGENEIINVTMDENATGYVAINITNTVYVVILDQGKAQFNITGLTPGNYTNIRVIYQGDSHYNTNVTHINFTVNKTSNYIMDVKVDDIFYHENATVRVLLDTSATGNVTIYIDDLPGQIVNVTNGTAVLGNISNLATGVHRVNVTYNGDSLFVRKEINGKTFTVKQNINWEMDIDPSEHPYGENTTIIITLPDDISAKNVTIRIGDAVYVVNFTNHVANLTLNNLSAGLHDANATTGDVNHTNKTFSFTLYVPQATPTITVIRNGTDLIATVTGIRGENLTGNVTFLVNNVPYPDVVLVGRNVTLEDRLKIGDNYVIVSYNGNDNYTTAENADVYTVPRLNTPISVNVTNITYGENELINVTVNKNATGYITIRIDGQSYTKTIYDGIARFNITGLAAKTYSNVTVIYYPDTIDYNGNTTNITFRVGPTNNYKFNVKVDDIEYKQDALVRVSLESSATGNVTIFINGTNKGTVNLTNGEATLNVPGLGGGHYLVNVVYNGDSSYSSKNNDSASFNVNATKWEPSVTEVDYEPYGEYSTINITNIPKDIAGVNLTVEIGGSYYNVTINKTTGKATLRLNNLPAGSYTAHILYPGDANYSSLNKVFRPSIDKATPTITLENVNGDVVATISGDATGNVTFYIPGGEYTVNLTSGRAILGKGNLTIGMNGIIAIYNGDGNYSSVRGKLLVNIGKDNSTVNVTAGNETYGTPVQVTVTAGKNQTGYVTIDIIDSEGHVIYSDISRLGTDEKAIFTVEGLNVGVYRINVTYYGDGKFNVSSNYTYFNITPAELNVSVIANNITVRDNASFIVYMVTKDFQGYVLINISSVIYDGVVKPYIYATKLPAGQYEANVTFYGDNNYNNKTIEVNFTVSRVDPTISVIIDDVTYPNSAVAHVTVSNNANGTVEVYLGDTLIGTNQMTNGQATVNLAQLSAGNKEVTVKFITEDYYNNNISTTKRFAVYQNQTTLTLYKNGTDVIAVLDPAINATIVFNINGEGKTNVTVKGNATIKNILKIGTNSVFATFAGNENYTFSYDIKTFDVAKTTTDLTVVATSEVVVGQNTTITVRMTNVTTGKVLIEIGNYNYTVDINNGVASLIIALPVDDYTVKAYYTGDTEHEACDNISNAFRVIDKLTPEINITVPDDVKVGQIIDITVESNGDNLRVWINGAPQTIENGHISYNVTKAGLVTIYAETTANGTVYATNKTVVVEALKTNATLTIPTIVNAHVGEELVIVIGNITDGEMTVKVDGVEITNNRFTPTRSGNYTITVESKETARYYAGFNETTFSVAKRDSYVYVNVTDITVDDKAIINVTIPGDAKGYVILNVNGTNYTVNTTGGVGSVAIGGLGYGRYYVNATYIGDDQYISSINNTQRFNVDKLNTTVVITVTSPEYGDVMYYGQKTVINVTVDSKATGFITISVNGTLNNTLPIVDGKVSWIVGGLAAGNFTVYANYSGDDNYNANGTNKKSEIRRSIPIFRPIAAITIDADEKAKINIELSENLTGTVYVTVNEVEYPCIVSGSSISFWTEKLPYTNKGYYDVSLNYGGDRNYSGYTNNNFGRIYVNKVTDYLMNITSNDIKVGNLTDIVVNVPGDASGIVIIEIEGHNYTATIDGGKAIFHNETGLGEGKYNITAFFGDNKYANSTTVGAFYISKVASPIAITVIDKNNIKVNDTVQIIVSLPSDIDGEMVSIEINGQTINNRTVDGNATFYVSGITYGDKTVVARYGGNDKYVSNSTTGQFSVSKRSLNVDVIVESPIYVGDNATVSVVLPSTATGFVVVSVDGNNYTINLTSGRRSVEIGGLKNTTYQVNVTYLGDDQFLSSINNTQLIKVNKVASGINLTVSDGGIITNGSDINITIKAPIDVTGKVNVTLYKNNQIIDSYIVFVNEGTGTLHIESPAVGTYNVTARYLENDKYLTSENKTSFEVYGTAGELVVNAPDVSVNETNTVTVTIAGNHTGEVTIIITNATGIVLTDTIQLQEGSLVSTASLPVGLLPAGEYSVTAEFTEINGTKTTVYKGADTFTVSKLVSHITIKDLNATILVGENETIVLEITLDPRANGGNISVFVNGAEYKTNTSKLTITVPNLNATTYEVVATYYGNDWYDESSDTASFVVNKNKAPITVVVTNSNVGDTEQINVTLPGDAYGLVLLDIDGTKLYANATDGFAQFNITGLKASSHDINVTYLGNYKYLDNKTASSTIISKLQPTFVVNGANITFGDDEVITIETAENITSTIKVEIDGVNYTAFVSEGKGNLTITKLAAGDYNITIYFAGNEKYLKATAKNNFTVNQTATGITIQVANITCADNETVIVYVDGTGSVTLRITEIGYVNTTDIVDGKATFIISSLAAGNYVVNATYNGNTNLTDISDLAEFTVSRVNPTIDVTINDVTYPANATAVVSVSNNATGTINIYLGDALIGTGTITDGQATAIILNRLPAGVNKQVTVKFITSDNYNNNATTTAKFNVNKADSSIIIGVGKVYIYNESIIINLTTTGSNGAINVTINGKSYPVNGKQVVIENITAGVYTIIANLAADENYTAAGNSTTFGVKQASSSVSIDVGLIYKVHEGIEITLTTENATDLTVTLNGESCTLSGNKVIISGLEAGDYIVNAVIRGNENYTGSQDTKSFSVVKYDMNLSVDDITGSIVVGTPVTFTAKLNESVTGDVIFTINGMNYTVHVSDSTTAEYDYTPVNNATLTVVAAFAGNDKYNGNVSVPNVFNVNRISTGVEVVVGNITVGNVAVVNITVITGTSGNVTIKIGDEYDNTVGVIDGVISVVVPGLTVGDKTVNVTYNGNDQFMNSTNSANFTVEMSTTDIVVLTQNITFTENETVIVYVDGTGSVTLTIIEAGYTDTKDIIGGKATFVISGLAAGNYTAKATYNGDANLSSTDKEAKFNVAKATPDVDVVVSNITYYGVENITITVNVAGNVTVKVNGTVVALEKVLGANNKAIINVADLAAGIYPVEVIYNGNENYTSSVVNTMFVVNKAATTVDLEVDDIIIGGSEVINVTISNVNATGTVIISVDGENYTASIIADGKATYTVTTGLTSGPHTVVAIYEGDENFTGSWISKSFTVDRLSSSLTINVTDATVGSTETIRVNVTDGATGKVIITVDGKEYYVDITGGYATLELGDLTNKTYTVNARYLGDETYEACTGDEVTFNVAKLPSTITVKVDNITVGDVAAVNITVITGAAGNVTIKIGDEYENTVGVIDGVISVIVPGLTVGDKTVNVTYNGNDQFMTSTNSANFTVKMASSDIIVLTQNITYTENETVIVYVEGTGNVTLRILETGYENTTEIVGSKATFIISGLAAGKYTVKATYVGPAILSSNDTEATFSVAKAAPEVNIIAQNITYGSVENITIAVNTGGNVTVKVNGTAVALDKVLGANNKAIINVADLAAGIYPVEVIYNGNENYTSSVVNTMFVVSKAATTVDLEVDDIAIGGSEVINVTISNVNATGDVIISVDGENYTATITADGKATYTVTTGLTSGTHTVVAIYEGDGNFTGSWISKSFTVDRLDSSLTINVTNTTVGSTETIRVNVTSGAKGVVVITVDGKDYYVDITGGYATLELSDLTNKTYTVGARYLGDETYDGCTGDDVTFNVAKLPSTITVKVDNITVGDVAAVNITVITGATGNVTIKIGNEYENTVGVVDGVISVIVPGLTIGDKTVNVTYNGNDQFMTSTNSSNFTVKMSAGDMALLTQNITYTENETVIVYVDGTGSVTLRILETGYENTTEIVGDKATFVISGLAAGNYTAKATYNGATSLSSSDKESKFNVAKATSEVDVIAHNITYYGVENIAIAVNAGGNVTVKLNGTVIELEKALDANNQTVINVVDLGAGIYPVEVIYNGNENYTSRVVNTMFVVSKAATTVDLEVDDIVIGGSEVINVTISNVNATGDVIISVDGENYTATITADGKATYTVTTGLTSGTHTVVAIYEGDGNFTGSWTSKSFNVDKLSSSLTINVTDTTVGLTETIRVNVTDGATGKVIITVDGKDYYVDISGGYAKLELSDLTNKTYTVSARYLGDETYDGCTGDDVTFNVAKLPSSITVKVDNITVGDVAAVNITVITGATGNVTIVIGSEYNKTVGIVDGTFSVVVPGLTVGDKTVNVTYNGNDQFMTSSDSANFTVKMSTTDIVVLAQNITYAENETVIVYVDGTGSVTLRILETGYENTTEIVDGKATFVISGLAAGDYTVNATYNGNANLSSSDKEAKFSVAKATPDVDVAASDVTYGSVESITITVNAAGNITVKVNGTVVELEKLLDANNQTVINVADLSAGSYPVEVTYNGNKNYNSATVKAYFNVAKASTAIDLEMDNSMNYGESQLINITINNVNASGEVIISIDGENHTADVNGGRAYFTIKGLQPGNHTVTIIYPDNENLTGSVLSDKLEVSKAPSFVDVEIINSTAGNKQVINVTVPKNATGQVLIDIDGKNYYVNITDGTATLELETLPIGKYDFTVTYLGDEIYEGSSDSKSFDVSGNKADITVSVPQNVLEGEPVIVNVTVPSDATGNVAVKIGNITKVVGVTGGENEIVILDVPVGEYDVEVTYSGDGTYDSDSKTAKLNVTKAELGEMKVIDQGNGTIAVVVPGNVNGNVTVKVGDEVYNATVENGTAVIDLNKTLPGSYDVTATFTSDDGRTTEVNATVVVPKYITPISVSVSDANVGDTVRITVTVDGNITKDVTIEIDGKEYSKAVDGTGKAVFEIDTLTAGNKTVTATYDGDDYYMFNSTTDKFTVSKLAAPISVSATTSGNNVIIKLSDLPDDATGFVIVKIGNIDYGINITETKQVTVPLTKSGNYDVTATYLGDAKYLENVSSTSFTISIDNKVTIDVKEDNYGDDVVVKVTVPNDATGNVTVTIGNTTKVVEVTGGENVITIPDVGQGAHVINVTYSGDTQYDNKTVIKTIYVNPSIVVEDTVTRGWNSPYDYSAEFLDSDGHVIKNTDVQFIVNGKTYTAKTNEDGIAYLTGADLPVGTYNITSINPVTGQEITKKVTIVKRLIENKDLTKDYLDSKSYSVLVIGDDGKPVGAGEYVSMTINTVTYAVKTNENGYAIRTIGLIPGSYSIVSTYKDFTVKNSVKVKQTLKASSVTVKKSAKKFVLKATLKWSNGKAIAGKKVTFRFYGKTYSAKTNSKGIAQVTISKSVINKLKAGKKYNVVVKYVNEKATSKVTVKK